MKGDACVLNSFSDFEIYDESVLVSLDEGLVGDMIHKYKQLKDLKQEWEKALKNFVYRRNISRMITTQQEEMCQRYYEILKSDNPSYGEYKKAFNFICSFMGLTNKDVIIEYIRFDDDKYDKDRRSITVRYSKGKAKVKIPDGMSLVHVSPVKGIQALNPTFKSKQAGTYLCPDRRVYFTIAKDIKANRAKLENLKLYRYRPTQKYTEAYIDPACQTFDLRAVYIESNKPIPVEPYYTYLDRIKNKIYGFFGSGNKKEDPQDDNSKSKEPEKKNEAFNFEESYAETDTSIDGTYDTIQELYIPYEESEIMHEWSFKDFMNNMQKWKTSNKGSPKQTFENDDLSDDEFDMLRECMLRMKDSDNYNEYKQFFSKLCRFCHILPTGTVLYEVSLTENTNKIDGKNRHTIKVIYAYNTKKIQIPQDATLYHMSKVQGIKALNPTFRSKEFAKTGSSRTQYFYSSPRVYLTLNKIMIKWFADYDWNETVYKYVVDKPIKEAYVDPLVNGFLNRAIYVETSTPIKVLPIEEWQKREEQAGRHHFIHKKDKKDGQDEQQPKHEFVDWCLWHGLSPIIESEDYSNGKKIANESSQSIIESGLIAIQEALYRGINKAELFHSPESLYKLMHENIEYEEYTDAWRLKTPEQTLNERKGNCIDQAYMAKYYLEEMGYKCDLYMIIEYDKNPIEDSQQSHVFVVYKKPPDHVCWFENAWGKQAGIHEEDEMGSIEILVRKAWKKQAKLPNIWFGKINTVGYGCPYYPDFLQGSLPKKFTSKAIKPINESSVIVEYDDPTYTKKVLDDKQSTEDHFETLQEEMLYLLSIDEVYFGKSEPIAAIEAQIDKFRRKYIHTKLLPLKDPDLLKLNSMIEEQFGFGNFSLYIIMDPIPMACTSPIEYTFDIEKKDNNYIVDTTTFKFKKEYNYTCMITMSTGLIFNPQFTTEEIMACILYELGLNFYSCFSHTNAILSNIYAASKIASTIANFVSGYSLAKSKASKIVDDIADKAANQAVEDALNDPINLEKLSRLSEEDQRRAKEELRKAVYNASKQSNLEDMKGTTKGLTWTLIGLGGVMAFSKSVKYYKFQAQLQEKFNKNSTVQSTMIGFSNYLKLIGTYILRYGSKLASIFNFVNMKLNTFIKWAGIKELLLPLGKFIALAKNPLSWLNLFVNYRIERAANNFPTMYGYGAAMVSYFEKMKGISNIKNVSHFINNHPILGILYDTITLPAKIITSVFDSNPSNLARCYDQIKMLETELQKDNLPDKMKTTILRDIAACKATIKELTDISKGTNDPDLCKKLYNKTLEDFLSGTGLKEYLIDDKSRFAAYDKNIAAKIEIASDLASIEEGLLSLFKKKKAKSNLSYESQSYTQWVDELDDDKKFKALKNYIIFGMINTKLKPGIIKILKDSKVGPVLSFNIDDKTVDNYIQGEYDSIAILDYDVWEHPDVKKKTMDARDFPESEANTLMLKTVNTIADFINQSGYGAMSKSYDGDWDSNTWCFKPNKEKIKAFIDDYDKKHQSNTPTTSKNEQHNLLMIPAYLSPMNEEFLEEYDLTNLDIE